MLNTCRTHAIQRLEALRRCLGNRRLAAQPEYRCIRAERPQNRADPFRRRGPVEAAAFQQPCRELHARTIAKRDIGASKQAAYPGQLLRQNHHMRIGVYDEQFLPRHDRIDHFRRDDIPMQIMQTQAHELDSLQPGFTAWPECGLAQWRQSVIGDVF